MTDTFAANFVLPGANSNTYVCVEARNVNNGETEVRYDNNIACATLTGTMQLSGPTPNPAFKVAALGIIIPKSGPVTIDVTDVLGRVIIPEMEVTLPAGKTNFNVPIDALAAAEYFIRVKYNDDTQVRKLIVR